MMILLPQMLLISLLWKESFINNSYNHNGISMNFNFRKTGIESGFENQSSFLIHYHNLELVRVY